MGIMRDSVFFQFTSICLWNSKWVSHYLLQQFSNNLLNLSQMMNSKINIPFPTLHLYHVLDFNGSWLLNNWDSHLRCFGLIRLQSFFVEWSIRLNRVVNLKLVWTSSYFWNRVCTYLKQILNGNKDWVNDQSWGISKMVLHYRYDVMNFILLSILIPNLGL